jgi:hypothetical protein
VKSAYHGRWKKKFATRQSVHQGDGTSNLQVWKNLWKLQLSEKIKNFGWRAHKDLLSCRAILANKQIRSQGGCQVCQNGAEDIKHLIFSCD